MFWTVQMSSCVWAQGELVEVLGNGEITVRDGTKIYRGRPVGPKPVPGPKAEFVDCEAAARS